MSKFTVDMDQVKESFSELEFQDLEKVNAPTVKAGMNIRISSEILNSLKYVVLDRMQYILSDIEIDSIYNDKLDIYFIKNKFMYTEGLIPNEITF
jgi:tyrosine-protein phosphatase YwqE